MSKMDSKYYSSYAQKCLLSFFLKNASANPDSKVFSTCITCCDWCCKRKALQPLDPNIQAKRRVPWPTKAPTRLNPSILPLNLVESRLPPNPPKSHPNPLIPPPAPLESRLETTIPPPNPPESRLETPIYKPTPPPLQPQALGFLPANQ